MSRLQGGRSALIVCLLLSFAGGASINSLATSLLAIQHQYSANNELLGRVQLLFFLGGAFIVVAGGWLTERIGERLAALSSFGCLAVGAVMVGWAPSLNWVFGSAALLGFGCIWSSVSYSVIVARHYQGKRQSMFSIISLSETTAAVLQPIAFSAWFARVERGLAHSWLAVFFGLAVIPVLGFILVSLIWKPSPAAAQPSPSAEKPSDGGVRTSAKHVVFSGAMFLIGLCVLMHGVYQIGYVSWIGPYDASRIGITPALAAVFVSVNNIGFFVARALLGWVCVRWVIPDLVLLGVASAGGSAMIVLALLAKNYNVALALCFLEGFFVAGDSPAMSSFVGGRFLKQASLAYAVYAGYAQAGGAAGGYLIGLLTRVWRNIQVAIWVLPAVGILLSLVAFTWYFVTKRSPKTVAES